MSADLAIQRAVRSRLVSANEVIALVPAKSILDRHSRPVPDPSIIIGDGQSVLADQIDRKSQTVFIDLHIWKKEASTVGAKAIAGAVRHAIQASRLEGVDGFHIGDCRVTTMRFLRDPDGLTSHGVVSIEAMVSEVA